MLTIQSYDLVHPVASRTEQIVQIFSMYMIL